LSEIEDGHKLRAADEKSAVPWPMKDSNINPEDAKLSALLRESRSAPSLPSRFQEGVWRRIEATEATACSTSGPSWLDTLAALVLRPRPAFAVVAVLIVAGGLWGAHAGNQFTRHEAQTRYLAAVAPNSLR